jgi:ketosteroid isomerase-like protein
VQELRFTDLVQKYYTEVDNGDYDRVVALYEVDAQYFRPGYPPLNGREAIRSFYVTDRIITAGVHFIQTIVCNAETVAVEGRFKGTLRGGISTDVKFADFFLRGPHGLIWDRRTYFYSALI